MSAREVIAKALRDNTRVQASLHCSELILSALRSAGWAVVPVEPTEGMKKAWTDAAPMSNAALLVRYAALIKAAQEDSRE